MVAAVLPANSQLAVQSPQAGTTPAFLVTSPSHSSSRGSSSRVQSLVLCELLYQLTYLPAVVKQSKLVPTPALLVPTRDSLLGIPSIYLSSSSSICEFVEGLLREGLPEQELSKYWHCCQKRGGGDLTPPCQD